MTSASRWTLALAGILMIAGSNDGAAQDSLWLCGNCAPRLPAVNCDRARSDGFETDMEKRAEQLREELFIPPPRGWPAQDRRIDLSRNVRGRNVLLAVQLAEGLCGSSIPAHITAQLAALQRNDPDFDAALTLAVAFREHGPQILSRSAQRVNSLGGGLDFLGLELNALRNAGYIPSPYGGNWEAIGRRRISSEPAGGSPGLGIPYPARVPRNELFVAYGATLRARRVAFLREAQALGLDTTVLTPRAIRAWTQIFFGGPGGYPYRERYGNDPPRRVGRAFFGGMTALQWMDSLIERGEAKNLNDILVHDALRRFHRVRRGLVSVGDAELVEQGILQPAVLFDKCLVGNWEVDTAVIRQTTIGMMGDPAGFGRREIDVTGGVRFRITADGRFESEISNLTIETTLHGENRPSIRTQTSFAGGSRGRIGTVSSSSLLCSCTEEEEFTPSARFWVGDMEMQATGNALWQFFSNLQRAVPGSGAPSAEERPANPGSFNPISQYQCTKEDLTTVTVVSTGKTTRKIPQRFIRRR